MQNMDELYRSYFQTVFKYLFCMTHDANLSEELTQETFFQALKSYKRFRGDCKVSVWLCQIAKYLWLKEFDKRKRFVSVPIEDLSDFLPDHADLEQTIWEDESRAAIHHRIQGLDDNTREVMRLRLTGEMSFREIGDILDRSENWARVTFYRGKQKLMKEEKL